MRYPGGKGGAGVYQTIINNIPPHDIYIESHLGGGNILERKRPAVRSIGIDIDREVIQAWQQLGLDGLELHCGDAVAWLEGHAFTGLTPDSRRTLPPPMFPIQEHWRSIDRFQEKDGSLHR
ncbi:hypothetical protein [Xanthomonas translucens]|uniref:hypothetical protein n=1 Tax=Xanthomonas campestris pv. translucens TaxID=343 RepID=UPI001F50F030|nr:hypothetical protein [Xanthomonas translucens]